MARAIHRAAIAAMQPHQFMARALRCDDGVLRIGAISQPLESSDRIHLLACGKAAVTMAEAALQTLKPQIAGGVVVAPDGCGCSSDLAPLMLVEASHPIPDHRSLKAGATIRRYLETLTQSDRFIMLLSGGSSALMEDLLPTLSLNDLQELTRLLLANNLPIQTVNMIRKHVSAIKGGRLAQFTAARGDVLVVSDVVGDDLTTIASAPLYCDPTSFRDCRLAMQASGLWADVPVQVRDLWQCGEAGQLADTPTQPVARITHHIVATNRDLLLHAQQEAERLGITTQILTPFLEGEARTAAGFLVAVARSIQALHQPFAPPVCLLCGGETTVQVRGRGSGGRNQELALAALTQIREQTGILLLCAASDGVDGNSTAAGALVDQEAYLTSLEQNLCLEEYLTENNSNGFFRQIDRLIEGGPSGTNVMDLIVMIVDPTPR